MTWEIAKRKTKRFKVLLVGPPGTFKTRLMLRLANRISGEPALAVIDTEAGTDQYGGEFNFQVLASSDVEEIETGIDQLLRNPGSVTTLGVDSMSVFCESVQSHFADLFLKREISSPGHKSDYYTLQPRDWVHINRKITELIKKLIDSDLHIVTTCQIKDLWDNMKIVGTTFDGFKRLPYYFDVVIQLDQGPDGKITARVLKDRTHRLPKVIPWTDDKIAYKALTDALGANLTGGAVSGPAMAESTAPPEPVQKEQQQPEPIFATREHLETLRSLKKSLNLDNAAWAELLKPLRVKSARDLTTVQADELIRKLEDLDSTAAQSASSG